MKEIITQRKSALALITGGASGLGYSFSKALASQGTNLVIVSRDGERSHKVGSELERKFGIKVYTLSIDLANPGGIDQMTEFLEEYQLDPDLVINNAGAGRYGNFSEIPAEKTGQMIQLNVIAPTMICHYFCRKRNSGGEIKILNVASTLGFRPGPNWAVYTAAKSYMISLSRSLKIENEGNGISVSVLCPGKIDTHFDLNAGKPITGRKKASSIEIAEYALRKMYQGQKLIIPGIANKIKYMIFIFLPDFLIEFIVRKAAKEN